MFEPTLILTPRRLEATFSLQEAANRQGWQVERLENWRAPLHLAERKVSIYGEPLFAEVVAETLGFALLQTSYDWLTRLPGDYLQCEVHFTHFGEARLLTTPMFVKPVDGKTFVARVYEHGADLPDRDFLPDETPALISEPVRWESEFRCFVLEGQVLTLSPYVRAGELAEDEHGCWPASSEEIAAALDFTSHVLSDKAVPSPAAFVLDVGMIQDRDWAVVESNAACTAAIQSKCCASCKGRVSEKRS